MKKFLMGILICMMVFGTGVCVFAQEDAAAPEEYEDFSVGLRFGTWALNAFVLPGLGSYILMQDVPGGTIQLVVGTLGSISMTAGVVVMLMYPRDPEFYLPQLIAGGTTLMATGIFNIIRSSTYHKPRPKVAEFFLDSDAWNIAFLPGKDGVLDQVQLSYTLKF